MSLAPQSADEVRPFLEELRRLDPLIDIQWDAKAVVTSTGSYSATGHRIDPTYDGRWMIIRYDDPNVGHGGFHPERGYVIICHVTEPTCKGGIWEMIALRDGGAYAPIGEWVVEMMRQSDGRNVERLRKIRDELWKRHDAAEAARDRIDEGKIREALDHNHFEANYAGGVGNWQGHGFDFEAMEQAAAIRNAPPSPTQSAVSRILTTAK